MHPIKFSVLSYYPSTVTNENVNVGILFHDLVNNKRDFHTVKNWNRIKSFDDELNIDFFKATLEGMSSLIESNRFFCLPTDYGLDEFIKYYVNELRFLKPQTIKVKKDEIESFISNTKKIHMRLDYDKEERLNKNDEIKYIKKLLNEQNIKYSSNSIYGKYNDKISYDYIIGEYGFKNFTFEGKEIPRLMASAKTWAFNAQNDNSNLKTVFVYDTEHTEIKEYMGIIEILSGDAYKVLKISEVLEFAQSIQIGSNDEFTQEKIRL